MSWRSTAWRWGSTSCWAATISTWRWLAWWRSGWRKKGRASTPASISSFGRIAGWRRRSCSIRQSSAEEQPVTILGKGTGLVGGTIKAMLRRADIEQVLGEGFLPAVGSRDMPATQRRVGLQELGLPYAADAAITRHMARFLRQQAAGTEQGTVRRGPSGLACPTHVLFNGGVLYAGLVRERILGTLNAWLGEEGMAAVTALTGEDLMHAVSRGAAYYGLARRGRGVRIHGGVPRTYYVGIESAHAVHSRLPGAPEGADGGAVRHGGRLRACALPTANSG